MSFGPDKLLTPIDIIDTGGDANHTFRFEETSGGGAGVKLATISGGEYYQHNDTSFDATKLGLYKAVAAAMTAAGNQTYTIEPATPSASPLQTDRSLKIVGDGAIDWEIDFGDAGFTMDPRWFGFTTADNPISVSGVGGEEIITARLMLREEWRSFNIDNTRGGATDKDPIPFRLAEYSSSRVSDAVSTEWESGRFRRMQYQMVPAAHVFERRANKAEWVVLAELGLGDTHNAFETVWDKFEAGAEIIWVHDTGAEDLQVDAHEYEIIKIVDPSATDRFRPRRMRTNSDLREIGPIEWWVQPGGTYDF